MNFWGSMQKTHVQFAILFGTLIIYLLVKSFSPGLGVAIGVLIAVEIFVMVGLEIRQGAKESGWEHEVIDTIIALVVALAIWFSASFILNTGSPLSGVVSCSMLPNLHRGDFVVVQGATVDAYTINMTKEEFDSLTSGKTTISGLNGSIHGSAYSYCVYHRQEQACKDFISKPETVVETTGPFTLRYGKCQIDYDKGSPSYGPCLESIEFKGTKYLANFSNDIIVYKSDPGNLYSTIGDIVHRVYFKINVDGENYYLTKGDNNPILDNQVYDYSSDVGNAPIPQRNVKGRVLFRIPLLGYFKLFISGFYLEDPQCSTQLNYEHV